MANDLNRFECIGRFGKDPEVSYSASGKAIATFSIALGSDWKDKATGQKQESTEWVRFVAFDRLAEIIGEYCRKGSRVYLSGRWRTRKWQDQSGQDRYTTEIVANELQLLDGKPENSQQDNRGHTGSNQANPSYSVPPPPPPMDQFDDDIPFNLEAA